ncbi:MAG: hypothetical protein HDR72_00940 [Ruminococcaceae bacterium]|nr:hypothetical protein [Oscillospiraceae bacterium]
MNKKTATILLVVFGNLLIITLGTAQIFLLAVIRPTVLALAAVIVLLVLHTVVVKISRKRFERRFGISAKRYILSGVMPAAAVSVFIFTMINTLMMFGIKEFLLWSIDSIPIEWIFSIFASGYSIFFLVVQSVLAAREVL